ncbi:tRNA pseudouridine(38-40) synthase [Sphaceloma murrayae]|uniref:tRNA pseudouridine(38-40) synthase n=1 Tax=Sphaceloma murrayae TaxID=2082308 RepID=A0A2K1QII8_9PEZI|nr:tRNA pseudouridine(38-40) synthase [Sphaceloma murrayae]
MADALDYRQWPADKLIKRVEELEQRLQTLTAEAKAQVSPGFARRQAKKAQRSDASKSFDPNRYSTRYIALKFAYLGQRYNGLEYHANNPTPLPTVEEELWKALMKTRLIFPTGKAKDGEVNWEGCEYSKCGRTDKGVSAFGQVVALKVRSSRPVPRGRRKVDTEAVSGDGYPAHEGPDEATEDTVNEPADEKEWDSIRDEIPYIQTLNRVLPEDIRALAWCPDVPSDFSARFSCEERQYRYFFTNPAYAPVPGARGMAKTADGRTLREGWLDIQAMQEAAKLLEGLHDFRNFCKMDPAKQISNYERRIFHASVTEVDPATSPVGYVGKSEFAPRGQESATKGARIDSMHVETPKLYTFNVNGSAFLWHQVRNMVAVLFLVGQGLEPPSIVSDLLNVEKTPTRPKYEMASDAPLVLWDCIFPKRGDPERKESLMWVRVGDQGGRDLNKQIDIDGGDGKFGRNGIMDALWTTWRLRKIDEVLAGSLIDLVAEQGRQTSLPERVGGEERRSQRVFDGGNDPRPVGKYVPVMKKERMEHFQDLNARWRQKKGLGEKDIKVVGTDE